MAAHLPAAKRGLTTHTQGSIMSNKRILLADDSVTALTMHRMILAGAGYEMLTAQDGQEAIELATAERPDLILMDVVMPRKTGFEATRILRKQEATKSIPVIMVTTRAEPKILEICFQCGCNDYINKPVDGAVLLAKVRSILGN
jgi:CheY-like chemotaxis protein